MPQTKPMVSIENVVASATVNQTINLNLNYTNFSRCRISSRSISRSCIQT